MRKFKIKSRSQKDIFYDVVISDEDEITCTCPSGSRGKSCNHLLLVMDFLNRKSLNSIDYDRIEEIK